MKFLIYLSFILILLPVYAAKKETVSFFDSTWEKICASSTKKELNNSQKEIFKLFYSNEKNSDMLLSFYKLIMVYCKKTSLSPDLEFIKNLSSVLDYIKNDLIDYNFDFTNLELNSLNLIPNRIDGKGPYFSGMSPNNALLTEKEKLAYNIRIKERNEYLNRKNEQEKLKWIFQQLKEDLVIYIQDGLKYNSFKVQDIEDLKMDDLCVNKKNKTSINIINADKKYAK